MRRLNVVSMTWLRVHPHKPDPWRIHITPERAEQIRVWRVDEGCTWRGVASAATVAWASREDTNQMLGFELCRIAAGFSGEDHRVAPWN